MREMFRTHISHRTLKQLRHTLSLNNGQTLVETALSIAALLMFIIGSAEIGLAAYSYHFISDASREATRYAIVRGSTWGTPCLTYNSAGCTAASTDIQEYVQNLGLPGIQSSNLTVTPTWASTLGGSSCPTCNAAGDVVQVQVKYAFPFSVPFVPRRILTMSSTSEMVISQ